MTSWLLMKKNPTDFHSNSNRNRFNPHKVLSVILQNLFETLLLCLFLTGLLMHPLHYLAFQIIFQLNMEHPIFLFQQYIVIFSLKRNIRISIEFRLQENITEQNSIAHGVFIYTTSKLVIDSHDAERAKHQREGVQGLDDPLEHSLELGSWGVLKNSVNKFPEFMPQITEIDGASSSMLIDKCQTKLAEPKN